MANIFSNLGSSVSGLAWQGLENIVTVVAITLAVIVGFGIIMFLLWWKSYNYRVKIYEPIGQIPISSEELKRLASLPNEEQLKAVQEKKIKFNYIRYKTTHGKFSSSKGTPYFVTFMPNRKLAPIPMNLLYDDGIHLIKLSRDVLVPIYKPNITLEVGSEVVIGITDDYQWREWNNLMFDKINNKYQDLDVQKKIAFYFVVGIVAIILLGGFIIWLIYKSATRNVTVQTNYIEKLAQNMPGYSAPQ